MARGNPRPFSASSSSASSKPKSLPHSKTKRLNVANAYTYTEGLPKRHRTSAPQNSLSHDEIALAGPSRRQGGDDEDDEDDMDARVKKLAMMIADEAPNDVESDESDVDSDDAWESGGSDEERWGDAFRELDKGKGKKGKSKAKEVVRKPTKPLTVNLDESDDEAERPAKTKGKQAAPQLSSDAEDDEEEEEDLEDEEDELEDEEDASENDEDDDEEGEDESDLELPSDLSEDEGDDRLDGLDDFVDQLASADKKRKAAADGGEGNDVDGKKKRRVLPVAPGPELKEGSDMALKSNQKLDLSSLISSHPSLSAASALLPSKADKKASSSILKQGLVSAPLPTVVQDRLDREAAYEKTKEEGQKWGGVMKRVKEAEHLSFPLQAKDRGGVKSGNEVLADFKPENKLESAVTALLNRANLTEDNLKKTEDKALEAQEMSMEEIKERRAALRYQRELLFRAEAKAKRVAKIKSKTFRKLARKRAAKDGEIDLDDLERLDPARAEEEREKLERDRARERATLRHGAKTSKWAKDIGGGGGGAELEDRRKAKEEMLDIKERLQRKIQGRGDGSDSESESEDDEEEEEEIKGRAFDQLAALDVEKAEAEAGKAGKGLMQMAFMKKAQDREMRKVAEEQAELKRDIEMFGRESDEDDEEEEEEEEAAMIRVGGNEGRMVFSGPTPGTSTASHPTSESAAPAQPIRRSALSQAAREPTPPEPFTAHNPWLVDTTSAGPSRKRNTASGRQNAKAEEKSTRSLKKAAKGLTGREAAMEDERVDIQVDGKALLDGSNGNGKARKANGAAAAAAGRAEEGQSGSDSEDDDELLPIGKGVKAFKQRDLVAEAFAGDNVVEDFEREKARQVEADAPKVEDTSLPGWGSWGGKGAKKRKPDPRFLSKTAGIEPAARKDFARSNVIITEKKDKKAAQFLVNDLPYPYTSKEQYERRFDTPVGSEWNSRAGYQRGTVPRVLKKPGAIIEPLQRLF